jgi:Tol biopolymer transport system component
MMRSLPSIAVFLLLTTVVNAQRVPVLSQIDLPHNYYYHELYLPQLTSGPSSAAWMPDGKTLVYSMAGSLWMQAVGSAETQQLTDDVGYDYQPDVSPDGKRVLFVRYSGNSMDVMVLNLDEKKSFMLTDGKSVSLEPRWSPDGSQLAFVSTDESGHFLLHTAALNGNQLADAKVLIADRKTEAKRYYYSAWDHSINPVWSRDGKKIYFVNNHDVAHGTGNLHTIDVASGEIHVIHKEETNWRMRPDVSPDGTRLVYSSYLGQNWHQLWLLPAEGGYAFPITYGHYDKSAPRWSPDGLRIAFISNQDGNTALWVVDAFTGKQSPVKPGHLKFITPRVPLTIATTDENGKTLAARISVTDSRGKFIGPADAWIHGDDSRIPAIQSTEPHYAHSAGKILVHVPKDSVFITASHGPAFGIVRHKVFAKQTDAATLTIRIPRLSLPADMGSWRSGDVHVHMNYGGSYRNTPERMVKQAEAEDLHFVYNLIVNKEQRIPDVSIFAPGPDPASNANVTFLFGQEFHTSFWGHLGLLNLKEHLILPDYVGYPQTAVASLWPNNGFVADAAHKQGAFVGYVHPYEIPEIFPDQAATISHTDPIDAALGRVDYYELLGFSDPHATSVVWYHLLNTGIRLGVAGGTDAMANYASLRGPVGLNRVFVPGPATMSSEDFLRGIKEGRGFATNGPIIGFTLGDLKPGDSLGLGGKKKSIPYKGWMRSNVPVEKIEVVYNGDVVATHSPAQPVTQLDLSGSLTLRENGWVLLRVYNAGAHPDVFDVYPYASTNPVFVHGGSPSTKASISAAYFIKWIDRVEKMTRETPNFRNEEERALVLKDMAAARAYYQKFTVSMKKK